MRHTLILFTALITPLASPSFAQITPNANPTRIDKIIAQGVLHVCTTGDYKPYSYYGSDGKFEGFDIDMMQLLATSLGVKTKFIKTSWSIFQFSEKAYMLPRGDVVFQKYVNQWLHLMRENGELQKIADSWVQ